MKRKTNRKLIIIGFVVLTIVFAVGFVFYVFKNGGISFTSDVTQNQRLWGEYQYQKEYILERDVFLQAGYFMIENDGTVKPEPKPLLLVPEGSLKRGLGRHNSSPNTIRRI